MLIPLAIWAAWVLHLVLSAILVDPPNAALATPIASFGLVLGARRIRRRMSAVDMVIPLALLYPITDPRIATPTGWSVAAATSVLPLVFAWFARRRR